MFLSLTIAVADCKGLGTVRSGNSYVIKSLRNAEYCTAYAYMLILVGRYSRRERVFVKDGQESYWMV